MSVVLQEYNIRMEGIRFRGKHGVSDAERSLPQDFIVGVEMAMPVSVLPESDRYKDVFDYDRVSSIVVREGTAQTYKLLEKLAARLLECLLSDTPATRARVAIQKSGPPTTYSVDAVSVELVASRG